MVRILVADDLADNRQLAGMLLQRMGYTTLMASDGIEALALIDRERPDLVLLDLTMPRMDGWEVCRKVKADPQLQHIQIVAFTASCDPADIRLLMSPDWAGFVTKPFDIPSFMETIRASFGAGNAPGLRA